MFSLYKGKVITKRGIVFVPIISPYTIEESYDGLVSRYGAGNVIGIENIKTGEKIEHFRNN